MELRLAGLRFADLGEHLLHRPNLGDGLRKEHQLAIDFGTSGKLYQSDLLMYDRQTHSLWAQMEGRAVLGERAGTRLALIPANTIAYEDFKAAYPAGRVLSRETGHERAYGRNPCASYDPPTASRFSSGASPIADDRRRSGSSGSWWPGRHGRTRGRS